jgi:hypothetical protein
LIIIIIQSSISIGRILFFILFLIKNSLNHGILSLNFITSSIIIIHQISTLFQTNHKKFFVALIIQSIKTKSNFSSSFGISSSAFQNINSTVFSSSAFLILISASAKEGIESSIDFTFHQCFSAAIPK